MKKKVVFLYSELSGYFLACIKQLGSIPSVDIHIVHWPINKEAPFIFLEYGNINLYDRGKYKDEQLIKLIDTINPSFIYASGWMDKGYLKICRRYKGKIPVVVGFDNQWEATFRQWLMVLTSSFTLRAYYNHCWIPGEPQKKYAELLGFPINNILTGFYCCDYNFFNSQYLKAKACKQLKFPKRFIYVGRYVAQKGIEDLWNAFVTLHEKHPNDWELWCLGTGDIPPFQHPRIKHFGFVQPSDMSHFIENAGVFVLPSYFEPWGVVIHEFATAGFPIICSDRVGARVNFVENNINGYIYTSRNKIELMSAMLKIVQSTDKTLNEMSVQSTKKASLITPEIWAQKLISLI